MTQLLKLEAFSKNIRPSPLYWSHSRASIICRTKNFRKMSAYYTKSVFNFDFIETAELINWLHQLFQILNNNTLLYPKSKILGTPNLLISTKRKEEYFSKMPLILKMSFSLLHLKALFWRQVLTPFTFLILQNFYFPQIPFSVLIHQYLWKILKIWDH